MAKEDKDKEGQPGKIAILAVLLVFVGCGCLGAKLLNDDDESSDAVAEATASPSDEWASLNASLGIPPKPDANTQTAYIAALLAIDSEIMGNHDEDIMVTRGRDQCRSIYNDPDDHDGLVELANRRFTTADYPDGFGAAVAEQILTVVHTYICPDYPMS